MRLTAGILTHNSERFAERCLQTLVAQTGLGALGQDWQIVCLDNASRNRIELARLERKFPGVRFLKEESNLGFGKSHNRIMRAFPAAFQAVLNVDVLFAPDCLSLLVQALEKYPHAGSAAGKLLRWDPQVNPEKTNRIDSLGIGAMRNHAFFDIGQGRKDEEKYGKEVERFGGSGAAVLYRRSALEEVACCGEFFDETMFMYKEDIDLAYRLLALGAPCRFVPEAIAWHARGVGASTVRRARSREQKIWAAAHETLLLRKHEAWWPKGVRRATRVRQYLKALYLLTFEPTVFFGSRKLLRELEPEAAKRRVAVRHRVSWREVAHLFF